MRVVYRYFVTLTTSITINSRIYLFFSLSYGIKAFLFLSLFLVFYHLIVSFDAWISLKCILCFYRIMLNIQCMRHAYQIN